jgi:thiosulfate/3-mercaptopyruvate sulfurtransferase
LEPWQKVLVSRDDFLAEPHGQLACTMCHGGNATVTDKETAHADMVVDPSAPPEKVCDDCHYDTAMAGTGLHSTLRGYWTVLGERGASKPEHDAARVETLMETFGQHCGTCHTSCEECHYFPTNSEEGTVLVKEDVVAQKLAKVNHLAEIEAMSASPDQNSMQTMFGNHCSTCHTSCGDCHISQPENVGGGFVQGHVVMKTPSMSQNCTACHGSRVGNEYLGKHEGIPGDAHFRLERMNCVSCHAGAELHSPGTECTQCHTEDQGTEFVTEAHRYSGEQTPSCESCHPEMGAWNDSNQNHQIHKDKLACQVCHSVSYTSCDGCHVAVSDKTGNPFYETEGDYLSFYIGRNPDPNYHRPYEYVVVRHVPASLTSYEFYGENLLPDFNSRSTWVYSTPHNIQKETPQNASCNACHGNAAIFLTTDKVKPVEVQANQEVIVDQIPPQVDEPILSENP